MVDTSSAKLRRKSLRIDQVKIVFAASEALTTSYSPYSTFQVGALRGACRQVKQKSHFEEIYYYNKQFVVTSSAQALLPFHFHLNYHN